MGTFELVNALSFSKKGPSGKLYKFEKGKPLTIENLDDANFFRKHVTLVREVGKFHESDNIRPLSKMTIRDEVRNQFFPSKEKEDRIETLLKAQEEALEKRKAQIKKGEKTEAEVERDRLKRKKRLSLKTEQ
jgi:hypothetical protein